MPDLKARIIPPVLAGALLAGSPSPPPYPLPRRRVRRRTTTAAPGLRTSTRTRWKPGTRYRVAAECTSINPADKARGVLDLAGQPDAHTDWFTQTGVIYHSSWRTPPFGLRETRNEYEPR
jgi:hypothetical protein